MPSTTKPSLALELLETSKSARYAAGERSSHKESFARRCITSRTASVKLTMVSKRGRGAVLGILGQADFFGEQRIRGGTA
jgi:CRP-like cAMP-binding protein